MKILVYGAGVLGSILAARLHKEGHEVSLLARGQRLADLREYGIVMIDDLGGQRQVHHVNLVEALAPDDAYDLVLVIMRKNQVADVLPILAANQHTPSVAFLGNNAAGPDAYVAALGLERVLMGFAGAGGGRDGHVIRHVRGTDDKPASLYIGELDGQTTPRLQAIVAAFEEAGFRVHVSPNIDAWLKTHVAFVSPIGDALVLAGGDNYRLARTRDGLVLMIRAIRESFAVLRALGVSVLPRSLAVIARLPEPILVALAARLMNTHAAEIAMARHTNAVGDEMRTIADELRVLVVQSGVPTPNLDRLSTYLNPAMPPMPDGSRALSLNWAGVLWGLLVAGACALPALRRSAEAEDRMSVNTTSYPTPECAGCRAYNQAALKKLGVKLEAADYVVALAGNPNTGKSTVFNALTGLRQHVGNWPGKTVVRAEGGFDFNGKTYKVVDLPGTYSLLSTSMDEEIARDFILFGQPTVTVVVVDATRLERNLNLTLQILQITDHVVVALNLIDEAKRHGIRVDVRHLSRQLGVPVVPMAARRMQGIAELLQAIEQVASGAYVTRPYRIQQRDAKLEHALEEMVTAVAHEFPNLPNARWVALRLLDGDASIKQAVREHTLGDLSRGQTVAPIGDLIPQEVAS